MTESNGILIFLVFFSCLTLSVKGQICRGAFGENIFEDGDFGSGRENIYPADPNIAPGYIYTDRLPVEDGFYTLTNDMGQWTQNYDTWISITDHSDDPEGYMMVVNASYEPGKFYEQTIDNLCANTIYEFSVDVINLIRKNVPDHIYPELEFLINDEVRYSTGKIPQDEEWHKYGFTIAMEEGATSLKLTLANKAPGGTGNDLALDNITFRPCGSEDSVIVESEYYFCQGQPGEAIIQTTLDTAHYFIQWQMSNNPDDNWANISEINDPEISQEVSVPGDYFYRLLVASSAENLNNSKCRTSSEPVLSRVLPIEFEVRDTICEGNTKEFNGENLTQAGVYTTSFRSSRGCDSIVTLYLEVMDRPSITFSVRKENPLCHDSEDGFILIENTHGGYPPYQYEINDVRQDQPDFEDIAAGEKRITVSDRFGCQAIETVTLEDPPPFYLEAIRDTQILLGEELPVELKASQPIVKAKIESVGSGSCEDCHNQKWQPLQSETIFIEAENENGCTDEISFHVTVDKENLPITFPNSFSPNGDELNENFIFIPPPGLVEKLISVEVFDRWGNLIFQDQNNFQEKTYILWDGTNGRKKAEAGTYIFTCDLELIDGAKYTFSGEIQVIY